MDLTTNGCAQEWLVTNGLGGYASGTVSGILTRRYHGLLIAALPDRPVRLMTLACLDAMIESEDRRLTPIGAQIFKDPGVKEDAALEPGAQLEFRLETGLPVWRYRSNGYEIQKRVLLNQSQNTVLVNYSLLGAPKPVKLRLRPGLSFRRADDPVSTPGGNYKLSCSGMAREITIAEDSLTLHLRCEPPASLVPDEKQISVTFEMEKSRGYECEGSLRSPGYFEVELSPGQQVTLLASIESRTVMDTLSPSQAVQRAAQRRGALLQRTPIPLRTDFASRLVLAADQFLFSPPARHKDSVWARAAGDQLRTVIAGYHWFADWGRDTMISLEGLTLATGRRTEAGWILRTFAHYVKHGLIPNFFPEGHQTGLYHTADASLWFFHALARYVDVTQDLTTLRLLMPKLHEIMDAHLGGTDFGIGVDPTDGLLTQGAEGYQLTWMDAKVGDWVVTPRRGKAVEINALWYNALCCMAGWMEILDQENERKRFVELSDRAKTSFNQRFWCERAGYLYDVVDGESGDDLSNRPNQVFPISLPHPVLAQEHWAPVMDVVTRELLTPVGLRSLSPHDPNYKSRYDGDLRARDAAYHQGSVWAWLIGPYIDAWLKVHPDSPSDARRFLEGFVPHLDEAGVGSISEIFDGDAPHTPRGCIAQAWSVAEVLRCWFKTSTEPKSPPL